MNKPVRSAKSIANAALRAEMSSDLEELTEPQREFFYRIFGEDVSDKDLTSAYELVQRTLRKNERR